MTTTSPHLDAEALADRRRGRRRALGRAVLLLPVAAVAVGVVGGLLALVPVLVPPLSAGLAGVVQVPSTLMGGIAAALVGVGYTVIAGLGALVGGLVGSRVAVAPVMAAAIGAAGGAAAGAALVVSGVEGGAQAVHWILVFGAAALAAAFVPLATRHIHDRNPF